MFNVGDKMIVGKYRRQRIKQNPKQNNQKQKQNTKK